MKCRLHSSDLSSAVGVCASCLRERLFLLVSARSQNHQLHLHHSESDDRPTHHHHPPITFPRSVSPYVSRSKFDQVSLDFSDRRFHSTPQIGAPISDSTEKQMMVKKKKKKKNKFSFIMNLFKSRSDNSESDPRTASTSSPLWRRGKSKSKSVPKFVDQRIPNQTQSRVSDRGMSPETSSCEGEESCEPTWKQTPVSSSSTRRRHSNMSGLAFCLSPLVRASPNRNWKTDSLPAESGGGEGGAGARRAVANSFSKNRSKKMADFGRGVGFDHRG